MNKILIVGGGFAGLWAALAAKREIEEAREGNGTSVTLVSRDGYLTVRPRLYERDPETLRTPLRPVLDPVGVALVEATVTAIDAERHTVSATAASGGQIVLSYDRLVLATGSALHSPPIPGIAENSWNIDTYDAALAFDRHLRTVTANPGTPGNDTFVIIGGGFTGIELAMEMRCRIAVHAGEAAAAAARVILVDRSDVIGRNLGDNPRPFIAEALRSASVETRTGTRVARIASDSVVLGDGERIGAATVVVTAGLRASALAQLLGTERDEIGRLAVDEALRVRGVPDVYATGDIARAYADDDRLALMSCQHALTMGRFAGYNTARDLLGLPLRAYRQPRYVTCLDLGSWGAVFTTGWDRRVELTRDEAKQLKHQINSQRIYPPTGDCAAILAAAALDAGSGDKSLQDEIRTYHGE